MDEAAVSRLHHPDVQRPWSKWSENQTLHVAVGYSNPFRWKTRRQLANNFKRHMANMPNVRLYFCELAYGDRPHEVTGDMPGDLQLRTSHELFHKENLQNRAIQSFDPGWKYGCCIDADFMMTRHDWALEVIHQLQHYEFLQPYSSYVDLSGDTYGQAHLPLRYNSTFFFNYRMNGNKVSERYHNANQPNGVTDADGYEGSMLVRGVGATGGALAFRREAFDKVEGMLSRCILGHADWYMAYGLLDIQPPDIHTQKYTQAYKDYVQTWRERARAIKKNVGYVDAHAIHYFHGSKTRRAYSSRDEILARHAFDPYKDVWADSQGILQLTPEKPGLRDDIRLYFTSRFEDDPNIYGSEHSLV